MACLYANNAGSKLVYDITAASNTLNIALEDTAKFPAIAVGSDDYFYVTIENEDTLEICKVVAFSKELGTFTIVRAQNGTAALDFPKESAVELRAIESNYSFYENGVRTATKEIGTLNTNVTNLNTSVTNLHSRVADVEAKVVYAQGAGFNPVSGTFGTGAWRWFTTSETFTVPANITDLRIRCWGGGATTSGTASCLGISATGNSGATEGRGSGGTLNYKGGSSTWNYSYGGGGCAGIFGDGGRGGAYEGSGTNYSSAPGSYGSSGGGGGGGGTRTDSSIYHGSVGGSCAPQRTYNYTFCPDFLYVGNGGNGGSPSNYGSIGGTGGYGGGYPCGGTSGCGGGGWAMGTKAVTPGQQVPVSIGGSSACTIEW